MGSRGEDQKSEGLLLALQGPRWDATPTSFSFFTAYTVFLSTARYTHPKPPSPIFSSSEKLWVPWEISWRGQQNGEGWVPCRRDTGFPGLCCRKRPQSGKVLSPPLCPGHKLPPSPLPPSWPSWAGWGSLVYQRLGFLLLVWNLSWGQDPPTLVEEDRSGGGGGPRAAGLGTRPSSGPE